MASERSQEARIGRKASEEPARVEGEMEQAAEKSDAEAKMVQMIAPGVFLNVLSGAMLFAARSALVSPMFKSTEEVALFLSRLAGAGAFSEFLINPLLAKLSDVYGRSPWRL